MKSRKCLMSLSKRVTPRMEIGIKKNIPSLFISQEKGEFYFWTRARFSQFLELTLPIRPVRDKRPTSMGIFISARRFFCVLGIKKNKENTLNKEN